LHALPGFAIKNLMEIKGALVELAAVVSTQVPLQFAPLQVTFR
jgi:hypothetical protein